MNIWCYIYWKTW